MDELWAWGVSNGTWNTDAQKHRGFGMDGPGSSWAK